MAAITSMVVGAVAGVAGAVGSFVNAAEAEAAAEEAKQNAAEFFGKTYKESERQLTDLLAVRDDLQRQKVEAIAQQDQDRISAIQESGDARAFAQLQNIRQQQVSDIQKQMDQSAAQMMALDQAKVQEQADISREKQSMFLAQAGMQDQIRSEKEERRKLEMESGFRGINQAVGAIGGFVPLYPGGDFDPFKTIG